MSSSLDPSSLLVVTAPLDSNNPTDQLDDLRTALGSGKLGTAHLVHFPQFKVRPAPPPLPREERAVPHPSLDTQLPEPRSLPSALLSAAMPPSRLTLSPHTDRHPLVPPHPLRAARKA